MTIITMITMGMTMPGEDAMFDDFFLRAIVAGVGLALTTGPLGCFIIWRRMAYFGDTISHSALLGVALSLLFQLNLTLSVFAVAALVSILLLFLQRRQALSADALLGILSHATLAIGLVIVAFMSWVRIDLIAFLFGDILAVSQSDIAEPGRCLAFPAENQWIAQGMNHMELLRRPEVTRQLGRRLVGSLPVVWPRGWW